MKKNITLLLSLFFITNTAIALDSVDSLQSYVVDSLNSTVVTLKEYFKKTDKNVKEEKVFIKEIKEQAEALKNTSSEKETNPMVLKQGVVEMPTCNTANQELAWDNNKWACITPSYGTDCYPAKDEYRYEENGKIICSKAAKGQSLNYYWKFRGYLTTCDSSNNKYKIYGCYYKNKNNQEIQLSDNYCNGKAKPYQANKTCIIPCITQREPASGNYYDYRGGSYLWFQNRNVGYLQIKWGGRELINASNRPETNTFKQGEWTYHRGARDGNLILFGVYRTRIANANVCTR